MKKVLVALPLLLIAILAAALYGALHNQISYTIANEYFTKFKFIQFGLASAGLPDRVAAGSWACLLLGGWAYP